MSYHFIAARSCACEVIAGVLNCLVNRQGWLALAAPGFYAGACRMLDCSAGIAYRVECVLHRCLVALQLPVQALLERLKCVEDGRLGDDVRYLQTTGISRERADSRTARGADLSSGAWG